MVVPDVYYINLADRTDRNASLQQTLSDSGISADKIQRVEAIDTRSLNADALMSRFGNDKINSDALAAIRRGFRQEHGELTSGSVGLYMSMVKVFETFLDSNAECALIFEDDAALAEHVEAKHVQRCVNDASALIGTDVLLLSHTFVSKHVQADYPILAAVKRFMMLSSYIITRAGAQKVIDAAFPMRKQLDHLMSDLAEQGKLRIRAVMPPLFVQKPFFIDGRWDSMQMEQPYQGR